MHLILSNVSRETLNWSVFNVSRETNRFTVILACFFNSRLFLRGFLLENSPVPLILADFTLFFSRFINLNYINDPSELGAAS